MVQENYRVCSSAVGAGPIPPEGSQSSGFSAVEPHLRIKATDSNNGDSDLLSKFSSSGCTSSLAWDLTQSRVPPDPTWHIMIFVHVIQPRYFDSSLPQNTGFISCTSTVRVDSPNHPLFPLAVIIKREVESTTTSTTGKCRTRIHNHDRHNHVNGVGNHQCAPQTNLERSTYVFGRLSPRGGPQ